MSARLLLWIAVKNVIHPFRRLLSRYRHRRNARFDRRAGVDTSGRVSLEELGLNPDTSTRYEATPIKFFLSVLAKISIDYPRTVFVDLGCGKGRTLLLASHYPFMSVIGVEISEALCRIAVENVKRYRSTRQNLAETSVVCTGIEDFGYDAIKNAEHPLVYMANPCGESVLAVGLRRLHQLVLRGTSVTIVYLNPVWAHLLEDAPWLKEVRRGETFDDMASSFMPYAVFCSVDRRGTKRSKSSPFNSVGGSWRDGALRPFQTRAARSSR